MSSDDTHPDGCPCKKTEDTVFPKMKSKKLLYYICPLTSSLNQMLELFAKKISFEKKTLTSSLELAEVVNATVCSVIEDPELSAVIKS